MASPTKLTLQRLREQGFTAQVVERWNPFAKVRQDLFGGIDIVAIGISQSGVLGIQCTTRSNMSARKKKLLKIGAIQLWMDCGNVIQVWGWFKKKGKWEVKIEELE